MAEEQIQHAAEQDGADDDGDIVLAEDETAEVDRTLVNGVSKPTDPSPGDAGGGSEDEAQAKREHYNRELRLANHASQDDTSSAKPKAAVSRMASGAPTQ